MNNIKKFIKTKWHIAFIFFMSLLLSSFILWLRLFIFYTEPIFMNIMLWSTIGVVFVIIPLVIRYDKNVKQHFEAIIYWTFFTMLVIFFPITSFINIVKNNPFINFDYLIFRITLNLVINYSIIGILYIIIKRGEIISKLSIMSSIIIVIIFTSYSSYDKDIIAEEYSFDFDLVESAEYIEEIEDIGVTVDYIYQYYEDTIYYYVEVDDRYIFGSYNIITDKHSKTYLGAECLFLNNNVMFYNGYTYLGCGASFGVLYDGKYTEMFNQYTEPIWGHIESFNGLYLIEEGNELFIYSHDKIFTISGFEILSIDDNTSDPQLEDGYTFISSINNKLFIWSEDKTYYDGYTYNVEFYKTYVNYMDGYIYNARHKILKDGEIYHFTDEAHSLILIDGRLYESDYKVLTDFETKETYILKVEKYRYIFGKDGFDGVFRETLGASHKISIGNIDISKDVILVEEFTNNYKDLNMVTFHFLNLGVLVLLHLNKFKESYPV